MSFISFGNFFLKSYLTLFFKVSNDGIGGTLGDETSNLDAISDQPVDVLIPIIILGFNSCFTLPYILPKVTPLHEVVFS